MRLKSTNVTIKDISIYQNIIEQIVLAIYAATEKGHNRMRFKVEQHSDIGIKCVIQYFTDRGFTCEYDVDAYVISW